jgi:RimJ/RimL family protein N-acetyltransferase
MLKIPEKLDSERLFLRPHIMDDLEYFTEFMCNIEATAYLNFTTEQKTQEGAKELLYYVIDSYGTENPIFSLSIILKMSQEYIGSCGLSPINGSKEAECYYTLLPEYWGNGYAIEAISCLFHYVFTTLDVDNIIAYVNPENKRSWKAAERAGMKYMGHYPHKDTGMKAMFYVVRKNEFRNLRYY